MGSLITKYNNNKNEEENLKYILDEYKDIISNIKENNENNISSQLHFFIEKKEEASIKNNINVEKENTIIENKYQNILSSSISSLSDGNHEIYSSWHSTIDMKTII